MLVDKYLNVDTADFQQLENSIYILHIPYHYHSPRIDPKFLKKVLKMQKKRDKYPKAKISNIDDVHACLWHAYGSYYPCEHVCDYYILSHYKEVEDGFLIKGEYRQHNDIVQPRCKEMIRWGMYLVGYDHSILEIKKWKIDPCPNKPLCSDFTKINVEVHLPEFENTEVRYPELSDSSIDSFILKNVYYPAVACENEIQGKVLVSFVVETDGSVSNIEIVKPVHPTLDKEAVRCVRRTDGRWISGMQNGEKIPMKIKIEFEFVLNFKDYKWRRDHGYRY
jgi:TonB family protein